MKKMLTKLLVLVVVITPALGCAVAEGVNGHEFIARYYYRCSMHDVVLGEPSDRLDGAAGFRIGGIECLLDETGTIIEARVPTSIMTTFDDGAMMLMLAVGALEYSMMFEFGYGGDTINLAGELALEMAESSTGDVVHGEKYDYSLELDYSGDIVIVATLRQ